MGRNRKQYFMYGVLISFKSYLDTKTNQTLEDVLKDDDYIQGIFTGRDGDFMIVGQVLEIVEDNDEPLIVPQLLSAEEKHTRVTVEERYGIYGDFHYYFIKK